jgi:enoyl-[acyl-carrier protein] reductase II
MRTPAAVRALNARMNPFTVFLDSFAIARDLDTPYWKMLLQVLTAGPARTIELMHMSQMLKMHTITLTTGDIETGMTASGMSVGLVHDVPTIAALMERMVAEAKAVQARLTSEMIGETQPRTAASFATESAA